MNWVKGLLFIFLLPSCQNDAPKEVNIASSRPEGTGDEKIYKVVDEMPYWAKCESDDFRKQCSSRLFLIYLYNNLEYKAVSDEDRIHSQIVVRFVIEKDGSITTLEFVKNEKLGRKSNLMEVLKSMPKWKPGRMNGEARRVQYNLPIRVRLE